MSSDTAGGSAPRAVHLVGVGGAGMSGLARILLERGHDVSGTDLKDTRGLQELRAMGATIEVGHRAEAVGDAEVVVRSSAVPEDNPEVEAARERGIPVWPRARLLAALMEGNRRVLVTGTHGKTTTTSMIVVGLQGTGLDPSFAIGGQLNEIGTNAHAGQDDPFVAEADESDRSFLSFTPDLAVVTNIELDHPDEFTDAADVRGAFRAFLARRPAGAPAVMCIDDAGVAALLGEGTPPDVVTYGEDPAADVRLTVPASGDASIRFPDGETRALSVATPGRHNLLNATAAVAACDLLGADRDAAAGALTAFAGAQRRFQRLGTAAGVTVVDDYAHHPTELRATLAAARSVTGGRVVLVVQPHRYSRTQRLGKELGRAAAAADLVLVTGIYASNEQPIPGVSGESVAEAAAAAGATVHWQPHLGSVVGDLADRVSGGDLVLITGAGDVSQVGRGLLERLRADHGG